MIKKMLSIYMTFLRIGTFTLGGGYAMIPLIQREATDVKKWVTDEEMADFIAIGQSLPGVVGINTAVSVGIRACGFLGALAALLGMVTPSFVVIILISVFFDKFRAIEVVNAAFAGVRAAVAAMVAAAVGRLFKTGVKDKFQGGVCGVSAGLLVFTGISPPFVLLGAVLCAVGYRWILMKKGKI